MQEETVDPEFEEFASRDIPIHTERPEFEEEPITDETSSKPASDITKQLIYNKLVNGLDAIKDANLVVKLMAQIELMTEEQAQIYFRALTISANTKASDFFIDHLIEAAANIFCKRGSPPEYIEILKKDQMVRQFFIEYVDMYAARFRGVAGIVSFFTHAWKSYDSKNVTKETNAPTTV